MPDRWIPTPHEEERWEREREERDGLESGSTSARARRHQRAIRFLMSQRRQAKKESTP